MQDAVANPWAAKARALDRYRWLLLRERHGLLGSALRFAREALGDWWFGVRAKSRLAESVTAEPCDFLLLQSAPKVIAFQRKKLLIEGLRGRGDNLVETALQNLGGARIVLEQVVLRGGERLFAAVVTLVCLTEDGHAARLPVDLRARLSGPLH